MARRHGIGRRWRKPMRLRCWHAGGTELPAAIPLAERALLHQHFDLMRDGDPFAFQVIGNRCPEAGIADPVGTVGGSRQVAALDLMLTLGTGFDPLQSVFDGEINGAVVAGLEMEVFVSSDASPVATVQCIGA